MVATLEMSASLLQKYVYSKVLNKHNPNFLLFSLCIGFSLLNKIWKLDVNGGKWLHPKREVHHWPKVDSKFLDDLTWVPNEIWRPQLLHKIRFLSVPLTLTAPPAWVANELILFGKRLVIYHFYGLFMLISVTWLLTWSHGCN